MDYHRRLDEELDTLRDRLLLMGGETEAALQRAMYALAERDSEAARDVLESDDSIDRLEVEIDRLCIDVLALRQPAARDQAFYQSEAKATAPAGDDDSLIFKAHRLCSSVQFCSVSRCSYDV